MGFLQGKTPCWETSISLQTFTSHVANYNVANLVAHAKAHARNLHLLAQGLDRGVSKSFELNPLWVSDKIMRVSRSNSIFPESLLKYSF